VRSIELDDATFDYVAFAARAAGVNESEIVRRAVEALRRPATPALPAFDPWQDRRIHASYRGQRVTAIFLPATKRVTVTSEPLAGNAFGSPSAAATAVVSAFNAGRPMNRVNGLRFWQDDATGARLDALLTAAQREPEPGRDIAE
jgi:negative regulator of replication initiation